MKNTLIIAALFIFALTFFGVNESQAEGKLKKHECTIECTAGHHVYKHGEEGHVCTDSCKAAHKTTKLKKHVCTSECTAGHHVYKHGEKGHVCTEKCKAMHK